MGKARKNPSGSSQAVERRPSARPDIVSDIPDRNEAEEELRHLLAHFPAVFYMLKLEGQAIVPVL